MDLYAENILDHYRHPRHKEVILNATVRHEEANMSCGDRICLSLLIHAGVIRSIGWDGDGCAISQAAMSLLSEELVGKSISAAENIAAKHVYELLGVSIGPRRAKCALLGLHTLKNAIHLTRGEPLQSWVETVGME